MNQPNRNYRFTQTWKLLEIARSPDISAAELREIANVLSERKSERALYAYIEVGKVLEIAVKKECWLAKEIIRNLNENPLTPQRGKEGFFEWPFTDAPASTHGFSGDKFFYKEGLLSYVGYHVGQQGVHESIRLQILDCVFHNELPNVDSPEYMDGWGSPETPDRLKKIAESLAAFARNAKGKCGGYEKAISDWESDLNYLYHKYYVDHFKFDWPDDREWTHMG